MNISNKTLAVLLLAAIVVSIGGTFISLQRLSSPTGYASSAEGAVQLSIDDQLSITTADSALINFRDCFPDPDSAINITSEGPTDGKNTSVACPQYAGANLSYIAVRNNGNVAANVTLNVSKIGTAQTGGTFLNSSGISGVGGSDLAYKIADNGHGTNTGGCAAEIGPAGYTVFESIATDYNACGNLSYAAIGGANSFLTHFEIVIPPGTDAGDQVTIVYSAMKAGDI